MTDTGVRQFELTVEHDMRAWLERAVIGLNLCPFAKAVHVRGQVHYAVSRALTSAAFAQALTHELEALVAFEPEVRETTLLIATDCLNEFLDFNLFLKRAERILVDLQLDGIVQIASFHPGFQFAHAAADDISNYTNRAPYPTLHLLRESSVDRAVAAFPQAESIFERNIQTLEKLGPRGLGRIGTTTHPIIADALTAWHNHVAR